MKKKDEERFTELMGLLGEIYSKQISDSLIDLYFYALRDLNISTVEKGITILLNTRHYSTFPLPADIREPVITATHDKAMFAWSCVLDTIQRVGGYESVKFNDVVIHSVVEDMGGWSDVCMVKIDTLQWIRKDFIERYELFLKQKNHPSYLIGRCETHNRRKGFEVQSPISIGIQKRKMLKDTSRKI